MRAESIASSAAEPSTTPPESGIASGQSPDSVQTQTEVAAAVIEEAEILHASVKAGSVAQVVVAAIAVLGLIYLLKLVLVTTLSAMLLAFILEPLVDWLTRIGIPRAIASLLAVVLMVTLAVGLTYFFYNRGVDFATQLPKYSGKIRTVLGNLRAQSNKIEESTRNMIASPKDGKQPIPVQVQEAPGLSHVVSESVGTLGEVVLAISFVPFLVYFMLTWKDHVHIMTVRLFPKEHRIVAHRTVARITGMIRSFITANLSVGLLNAVVSTVVFWVLGIPYFYFLGAISGFVGLIPYLGVFLALLPPLAGGVGVVDKTGILIIFVTVIGLHLISVNVLYPKIVGRRVRLNPLAVTLSLLFWAWIWGAMGLLLAVPLVGATKIVCDYVDSLRGVGAWLGE